VSTAPDPLGARPVPETPAAYAPPVPVSYKRLNKMTVWLLERHTLPIVSIEIVVPAGASWDPPGKGGLAYATADMLDEGAGTRDALAIARDVDRLGATLHTGAYADYAFVQVTALKKNLGDAAAIFGDVVTKPKMDPVEWKRVHDLWDNELRARQSDPELVAGVVIAKRGYAKSHPYAHPTSGTMKSAASVSLDDAKKFYARHFRPDTATCVVVGDVTRAELDAVLDRALPSWTAPAAPAPVGPLPDVPSTGVGERDPMMGRPVWVVDRPDAPQSVIAVVRRGVAAGEEDAAPLARVNNALGGSFTSRLNQDLREEHGWSYGARSRLSFTKMRGHFVAQAAVHTEHTGDALKAMLADIEAFSKQGLTDEEIEKTRLLARSETVEAFETTTSAARRLARNAGIGLGPEHETEASKRAFRATREELKRLASENMALDESMIVVVGPRAKIAPQLASIGITNLSSTSPEGE
jgi:predicted Zn-dependent peptidase